MGKFPHYQAPDVRNDKKKALMYSSAKKKLQLTFFTRRAHHLRPFTQVTRFSFIN
jgi:hypothetical protein